METMKMAVLKGGTSVFENENGIGINQAKTNMIMGHAVELQESGLAVVMTASGAVPEGKEYCVERGRDHTKLTSPQLARRGTSRQMYHFQLASDLYGVEITQNLATHDEIDDKAEGSTIVKEISGDAYSGVLAILNENPTTGNQETAQYDRDEAEKAADKEEDAADTNNDWLACHFAIAVGAKYVVLLSDDVDGFEKDGKVVEQIAVSQIEELLASHTREGYENGTGGIDSKLWAMARAADALKDSEIIFGNANSSPLEMILGNCICTRVVQ